MSIDWASLSPPQAAVLAALIGILAAVLGQIIGAVINTFASGRQAKKNRELDERKFNQQLRRQVADTKNELRRAAYLDYHTATYTAFEQIVSNGHRAQAAGDTKPMADLNRSLAAVALADAGAPVMTAANEVLVVLQLLAGPLGDRDVEDLQRKYKESKEKCLEAMATELRSSMAIIEREI